MAADQDRKPGIGVHLPGIFQSLAAGAIVTGLLEAVKEFWEREFHSKPPGWATDLIPPIAGVLSIPLIYVVLVLWKRFKTRAGRATPKARGDRISIYVAKLGDDKESESTRTAVMESIYKELDKSIVEILPAGIQLRPTPGVSEDEAARKPAKKARALLRDKGGDLLIWGLLHNLGGKLQVELHFTPAGEGLAGAERKIFGFGEKLTLDADFGPEMGAALSAIAAVSAAPAVDQSGKYLVEVLAPIAARLAPMIQNAPASMRPSDRAGLLFSFGLIESTIGEQSGELAPLLEAIWAYREALKERTRERVPLQWAVTQNNLGAALQALGERESGTEKLEEAVAAFREALKERTRERVPLQWAATQNNLGAALATLGERESGTERLEEAVAAYRAALEEYTRERVPLQWAATQNNLGNALATLGERESGTERLEEAVAAYREALEEYRRERVPLQWAMTQNNLGAALRTLGERESGTERLEEAVAAYREALEERTRERVPLDWAMTQNNLGAALQALGERESGTERLAEAGKSISDAWEVYRGAGMHHYDASFERRLKQIRDLIGERRSKSP